MSTDGVQRLKYHNKSYDSNVDVLPCVKRLKVLKDRGPGSHSNAAAAAAVYTVVGVQPVYTVVGVQPAGCSTAMNRPWLVARPSRPTFLTHESSAACFVLSFSGFFRVGRERWRRCCSACWRIERASVLIVSVVYNTYNLIRNT